MIIFDWVLCLSGLAALEFFFLVTLLIGESWELGKFKL